MATPTSPLSDWSQAPEAWQSYAKTIPQLENMPDNAYDALREKYFQEQVLPSMMKQGANYSPEASKQAFFEKTERPSRLPHSIEAAKTAASLLANQAAKAFVAPFAGTDAWDAQKMQLALERRGQELESEAAREWMSPTLPKVAGELVGQAPFWMAGMEGVGAAAKAAKVSPAAARLFNIGAGGIIQGSYDAAKAQDGHRLVEGVGGAAMGAAGVAAFEGLGAFLRGKGMTPEEADAVVATAKGSAAPKEEAMAASVASSSPNLTADINSWLADQVKVADRNGVPKGAVTSTPKARVKIQMTGADGAPYSVGGVTGISMGDFPAVVSRIAQHLEKGGSITSVSGDASELNSLFRQFEALNKARGEYDLSVPLKGQAESVVPTEVVVAPASQPTSLEDLETQAWNAVGSKQVTSPRSLQNAAPQLRLNNKVAKQLFDRMYPEVDESAAASQLKSSPQSSAGEGVAPVEPSGTPSPGEAPGAAQVIAMPKFRPGQEVTMKVVPQDFPESQVANLVEVAEHRGIPIYRQKGGGFDFTARFRDYKTAGPTTFVARSIDEVRARIDSAFVAVGGAPTEAIQAEPKVISSLPKHLQAKVARWGRWYESSSRLSFPSAVTDSETDDVAAVLTGKKPAALTDWVSEIPGEPRNVAAQRAQTHQDLTQLLNAARSLGYKVDWTTRTTAEGATAHSVIVGQAKAVDTLSSLYKQSTLSAEDHVTIAKALGIPESRIMSDYPAARVAATQLEQLRGYIGPEEMPHLDKLEVLASGRVRNKVDGSIYKNVAEAIQAEPKAGVEEPGGSRREFLKKAGGAAAAGAMRTPEQLAAALKSAEAGNKVAADLLNSLLEETSSKLLGFGKGFIKLQDYNDKAVFRTPSGVFDMIAGGGGADETGLLGTIRDWSKLPQEARASVVEELRSMTLYDFSHLAHDMENSDVYLPEDFEHLDKILPGFKRLVASLEDAPRFSSTEATKVSEALANPEKVDSVIAETRKVEADWSYREAQKVARPTGMELARTPLGLGEEGEGGVLTRFAGELEGSGRREFLKRAGGAAASLPLAQAKSLASAASEGGAGALSLLQTLLSKVGYGDLKIINSGKGFFELEDSTGQRYFRSIDGISRELGGWGAIPYEELAKLGSKLSPKHLDMLLSEIKARSPLEAINDAANLASGRLPAIEKFLPGFSKLHPKLVDIYNKMRTGTLLREATAGMPKEPFAAPQETSAALDAARAGQLEQAIRPTGKELARTPLGLGEAGEGGVLTRYGTSGEVEGKTFWPKGGGNAAWVSPKGKVHTFSDFEEHEATISDYLPAKEAKAYENSFGDTSDADQALGSVMAKGWVKIRDNTVSVSKQALDQPSLAKAMQVASEQSKSYDRAVYVTVRGLPEVRVRGADIGEFLSNPIKYIKTQPSGYGTNPNAPTTPTPGGWSFKETPQVSRLYGPGMTVEQTARASGAPTSMVDQLQGAAGAKGVTYPGSVTASGKPLVVLTEPSRGLIFHEMTHAHILATGLDPIVNASIEGVKPEMINALQGAFSPELKQMYGGRINAEELYTYSATAVRTDDQATITKFANADGGKEEFLDWVGQATSKLKEEVAATPDSLHRRVFERKLDEVNRRASSYIQDIQNGTFNVDGLSLSWERGKFIAETSDGQAHTFANRTQLAEWLDRNHNEPLNAPSAVDESSLPKGTPRYAADLPGFTNKKPPIHTDPPSPDLEDEPIFEKFHEAHPIWEQGTFVRSAWVAYREGDVKEARKVLARNFESIGKKEAIDYTLEQFERLNKERLSLPGPPSFGAAGISGGKTALDTPFGDREPAKGGIMLAWRFFQPFQDWIDIVARKNKWPELSDLFGGKLQGAVENVESHIYDNQKMLKSTLGQFPPKRQSDLYTYLKASEADRPKVAREFNFTGGEENAIKEFETKASGLADSYGSSLHNFVRSIAPSLRAKGYDLDTLVSGPSISKEDVAFWKPLLESGRVDPNDTNLLRLADGWVKGGARKTYLNDTVKEAEKFLSQRNVEGDRLVGDLRGALQRHLDFIKGMPDQSQQVVNAALSHVTELVNAGISKVNGKLPERFQIEPIDSIPQDILGKWVMYSYAGTIGLRPAIPIRAAMQMFITGYPILGGKYLAKGMGRMFPAIGEGTASEAYQVADKYGWLLKPRDYGNLYTGEGNIEQSATAKLAQRSLQPLLWGHNAARLAVGWGHVERFMDALRYKSDPDVFLSKSALNWLPTFKQQSYLREVQSLGTGDASDLAYRAAKDLVDVSQWNYRRGANPGLYEYGLGRLFGQYGTWPLNYIEFARKLATHPDKGTQIASLARLVLAHGAILKAGEAAGVDTGQWVFSQPMAYGGGPLFQAVRAVPGSLDFETQKGTEARKELIRPLWPVPIFVPGGMAAQQLIDAINSNSPDIYKILMGFKPLKAGEELKGEHGLLP